jgi:RimJ/RimL family protein N-acetyltransferase
MAAPNTPIQLRDPTLEDAALLDAWAVDPRVRGEFNDFGLEPGRSYAEMLANGPLRDGNHGEQLVVRTEDDTPIGLVGWHPTWYGPVQSRAWNIGIHLLPEARGQGYGTLAQRQLADWLFATTDANRVEAQTDVENVAEQRSLEKAGFAREGVLRGSQFRAGAFHDLISYARVRPDP